MFVSFLFIVVLFQATTFSVVALETPPGEGVGCVYSSGEYGLDSGYIKNLRNLITNMATHTNGFFESSAGHSQDKVYLTSFCFGDLSIIDCRLCQAAYPFVYAYAQCPKLKEATFWSDSCLMRYSPYPTHGRVRNISSRINVGPKAIHSSDLVHVKRYTEIIQQLLKNTLISSVGDSRHKFATAEAAYNTSTTIYSAMQCSPDLSRSDCLMCLQHALHILEIENGFGQLNARMYLQSCTLRYDQVKFYSTSHGASNSSDHPRSTGKGRSDEESKLIVALVAGFVSLTLLIVASIIIFIKLKKRPHSNIPDNIESY